MVDLDLVASIEAVLSSISDNGHRACRNLQCNGFFQLLIWLDVLGECRC